MKRLALGPVVPAVEWVPARMSHGGVTGIHLWNVCHHSAGGAPFLSLLEETGYLLESKGAEGASDRQPPFCVILEGGGRGSGEWIKWTATPGVQAVGQSGGLGREEGRSRGECRDKDGRGRVEVWVEGKGEVGWKEQGGKEWGG